MPLGKYCRKSPLLFSFVPRCQGACGLQKYVRRPVAASRALKPAISEPLSSVRACLSFGGTTRRQGMSAALKDAAVLSCTLASRRKRLLRSVQLSSAALPLEAQTRSVSQSPKRVLPATIPGRWLISIRPGNRRRPWPYLACRLRLLWARRKW